MLWFVITFHCVSIVLVTFGSLGSKETAKTGRLVVGCGGTEVGLSATSLGTDLAFIIAASIICSGYLLSMKRFFSSQKRFSLSISSLHILVILRACEYGILSVTLAGWHELVNRYWFRSVGFLYKSVLILQFFIVQSVSKNGIASVGSQSQFNTSLYYLCVTL